MNRKPLIAILLLLLLIPLSALAVTFPDKPAQEHFFRDSAYLIASDAAEQIDSRASALLKEEKVPLYVVTIPSLASQDALTYSIEKYATELFDHWGIGFQDRNYGILLLVSLGDRKARIELGADWGNEYDYQAEQVMSELIIPAFKRDDYATGIADGVRGLDAMARGLGLPKPTTPKWFWPVVIGGLILVILLIVNLFKTGRKGWAWALLALLGVIIFFVLRSAMSSSGSGGGFGGGSSGGGGATGSW